MSMITAPRGVFGGVSIVMFAGTFRFVFEFPLYVPLEVVSSDILQE